MPQGDPSTALLVDHMNEIDKRRWMLSISQKEVETKLMLAAQDAKDLRKTADAMSAEEDELKRALDALTEEQRKADLQLAIETARCRQCEGEEPLLHAHAADQLEKMDAERDAWRVQSEELEELRQAFMGDQIVGALKETIRQLEGDIQAKKREKETVEKETLALTMELARLRDPLRNRVSPEANFLLLSGDLTQQIVEEMDPNTQHVVHELKQKIHQEKLRFEQAELLHRRQMAVLQTEAEDLEMRTMELSSLLQDVNHAREHLASSLRWFNQCLEHQTCLDCMQNREVKNR